MVPMNDAVGVIGNAKSAPMREVEPPARCEAAWPSAYTPILGLVRVLPADAVTPSKNPIAVLWSVDCCDPEWLHSNVCFVACTPRSNCRRHDLRPSLRITLRGICIVTM